MAEPSFWSAIDELVASASIIIDRPKNSAHPRYSDMIYPVDYGYLDGTTASDGGGIDVWIGSDPAKSADVVMCTVDLVKRDAEIKILLGCSESEIQAIARFMQTKWMGWLMIRRTE